MRSLVIEQTFVAQLLLLALAMPDSLGTFSEDPQTTWLLEARLPHDPWNRDMHLLREFWFKDPQGTVWRAPAGSVVNGASIPAALWSTVGSPYTGPYRRASIVHDVACENAATAQNPTAARAAADYMFYQACLAGGCSPAQAELLFVGVRIGDWLDRHHVTLPALQVALLATARILPDGPEESVRTLYCEIAAQRQAMASLSFPQFQALVERHIQAKEALGLPVPLPITLRQFPVRPMLSSPPKGAPTFK